MKKTILSLMLMLLVSITYAEGGMDKWPALKTFHESISQTFHPSESGNLAPVKARAHELVVNADKLAASKIPAGFNQDQVKGAIINLQQETITLEKLVKAKADDKQITEHLSMVHNAFHQIVGLCEKGKE